LSNKISNYHITLTALLLIVKFELFILFLKRQGIKNQLLSFKHSIFGKIYQPEESIAVYILFTRRQTNNDNINEFGPYLFSELFYNASII